VQVEAVDRAQRKISLALAAISRAEAEEAATMKEYKEKSTEETQNMGTLGDMLKSKTEQKEK
jgi:small subunit ribosomal protein S1